MVKLVFHDPSGALESTKTYATRLTSLAGKRVAFLSNGQWQAYRMLPMLKTMLEEDFHGVEVLPVEAFPQGNMIGSEEIAKLVAQQNVDAVIVGNAA
jgi:hypothetical protein